MKYLSVLTRKVYTAKDGKEKINWFKAGHIKISDNGGKFLVLYDKPETDFYLFDSDSKESKET